MQAVFGTSSTPRNSLNSLLLSNSSTTWEILVEKNIEVITTFRQLIAVFIGEVNLAMIFFGISEFFVKKDAKLSFTMIHSWDTNIEVRPRTAIKVEEGGTFISNYVLLNPVKLVQTYPTAYVEKDGTVLFNSVIVALEGSVIDSGSRAVLMGENSRAELISRTISKGGKIIARGHIIGDAPEVKGHLECKGLMLSENGLIDAIPELEARYPNVELSHEAAIGKIAEEEIFYLMSRGLSRDEAVSAIVRGFMEIEIKGLPEALQEAIRRTIEMAEKDLL